MADGAATQYWYNLETGEVEEGPQSPVSHRAGPFASRAEAENAPEVFKRRNEAWDEQDRRDAGD